MDRGLEPLLVSVHAGHTQFMRTARFESVPGNRTQTILISNRLRSDVREFSFEERELVRGFMVEAVEEWKTGLLTWCVLPRSIRMVVRARFDSSDPQAQQKNTLVRTMKSVVNRLAHWRVYRGEPGAVWRDRYRATSLKGAGEILAGAASVDAYPVLIGLVDRAEDYFFCGFHHACLGDEAARAGIGRILGDAKAPWGQTAMRYRKSLEMS